MGNDINAVAYTLSVADVIPLGLRIATRFEDCFVPQDCSMNRRNARICYGEVPDRENRDVGVVGLGDADGRQLLYVQRPGPRSHCGELSERSADAHGGGGYPPDVTCRLGFQG